MLPVLSIDLVSRQSVVKHHNLVGVLQPWPGVVSVLQVHGGVQQRQVAADNQGVGAVCGDRWVKRALESELVFERRVGTNW